MITHGELLETLSYDPATGEFQWRISRLSAGGKAKAGARAGTIHKHSGYRHITVFRKRYRSGRLAWFYVHGRWPTDMVDHINGDRLDDRIGNLREATNAQNQCNRRATGKSGVKGVYRHSCGQWAAEIKLGGKKRHLGLFRTIEEAATFRREYARRLHGEFANAA